MTMTINQQFVDLAESAWMDGETQEYFNRFSPDHMDIDEFMDELDKRPEDELLANVFKAFGRDMYAEMHADGAHGVKDFIVWLYYLPDLPFIMMAWDMAADGWFDGETDSIGRMEDYDRVYILTSETPETWGNEAYTGMPILESEVYRLSEEWGTPKEELMKDLDPLW